MSKHWGRTLVYVLGHLPLALASAWLMRENHHVLAWYVGVPAGALYGWCVGGWAIRGWRKTQCSRPDTV